MHLAILAAALAVVKPVRFPDLPIVSELLRGEKVFHQHRGLERVLGEDRVVIGTWFDGRIRRDVEDAIWISPSLVSRWLGYLNAKEKWPYAELIARWQAVRRSLDGRATFVVQLSALPKVDPFELGADAPAGFSDACEARFLVTYQVSGPIASTEAHLEGSALAGHPAGLSSLQRIEPSVAPIGRFRSYDWRGLFETKWYRLDREFDPLLPEFESPWERDPYRSALGDHLSVVYRVDAPLPAGDLTGPALDLRVFRRRRDVAARFGLTNPRFVQ